MKNRKFTRLVYIPLLCLAHEGVKLQGKSYRSKEWIPYGKPVTRSVSL